MTINPGRLSGSLPIKTLNNSVSAVCVWGHCVARSARMHVMCDAKCTRRWFRHSNQTQEASTSPYTHTGLFPKYVQVTQTHKFVAMWDMAHVCCIRLLKPFSLHFFCGHLPLSFIKIVSLCIQTSMKHIIFFKSSPKGRKGRKHKAAQIRSWLTF